MRCRTNAEYIILTFYIYVIKILCHVSFPSPPLLNICRLCSRRSGGRQGHSLTLLACSTFKGPKAQTVGDLGLDTSYLRSPPTAGEGGKAGW